MSSHERKMNDIQKLLEGQRLTKYMREITCGIIQIFKCDYCKHIFAFRLIGFGFGGFGETVYSRAATNCTQ